MTTPSRLVFFGNERLVSGLKHTDAPILSGLIERGYDVVAVVVNHTDGTSRNARELEVAELAKSHSIPVFSPTKPEEIIDELTAMHADAAVLSAYGRILSERIINLFRPLGIINIHPSLLPRHRGPTPVESTILEGDKIAGVSIMQLSAGMDTGPLYGQASFATNPHVGKFELYQQLSQAGAKLLFELLPDILSGSLQPKPQENTDVSVTSLIFKSDGVLDPLSETATALERKVRAYQGYPKPHLKVLNNDVIVTSAKVIEKPDEHALAIPCADNSWLEITSLVGPSGKTMAGADFLRGYARRP